MLMIQSLTRSQKNLERREKESQTGGAKSMQASARGILRMGRKILTGIFIVMLVMLSGCAAREPKLSADKVDLIPDISIDECLTQIKQDNPEMPDQAARDNCWSIEAVNKGDKSLCNKVSEGFRDNCLAQF
jgi:hypothetical protein